MKYVIAWLILLAPASAVQIGDTYDQVVAERGKPKSQASVGANRILNYPDGSVQLRNNAVVLIKLPPAAPAKDKAAPPKTTPAPAPEPEKPVEKPVAETAPRESASTLEHQRQSAINRVKSIVNQPVKGVRRTDKMHVFTYGPGWFHDGALTPDFNTVDVRKTQEQSYDQSEYVASDLNPDLVFVGRELEFNPMTKYFYVDRTVPKKKLTEAEMVELNRLYRIIGRCDAQLKALEIQ